MRYIVFFFILCSVALFSVDSLQVECIDDAYVYVNDADWDTAHDTESGDAIVSNGTSVVYNSVCSNIDSTFTIYRWVMGFYTKDLPAQEHVTEIVLHLSCPENSPPRANGIMGSAYSMPKYDGDIKEAAYSDFDEGIGQRVQPVDGERLSFRLEDTDWYNDSDTTFIMIRESTYDVGDEAPEIEIVVTPLAYFESLDGDIAPYIMVYYDTTLATGWTGTIFGEENPAGVFGESVEDIESIWGE